MAKLTIEELIAAFKELTLVELNDFVKAFEEEFDVTAAAPVAAVAAALLIPRVRSFLWAKVEPTYRQV